MGCEQPRSCFTKLCGGEKVSGEAEEQGACRKERSLHRAEVKLPTGEGEGGASNAERKKLALKHREAPQSCLSETAWGGKRWGSEKKESKELLNQ